MNRRSFFGCAFGLLAAVYAPSVMRLIRYETEEHQRITTFLGNTSGDFLDANNWTNGMPSRGGTVCIMGRLEAIDLGARRFDILTVGPSASIGTSALERSDAP